MRKTILSFFVISLIASGLYFTQKSSAAVSTTIAPAGTSLSTQNGPLWKYPTNSVGCKNANANEPYAAYTFDITASGSYTFTMNTSGFPAGVPGQIFVYRSVFNPSNICGNIVNNQDSGQNYITGSPLTLSLSASSTPTRYVVVFTATNIVQCPNCPNQTVVPSNVNGTFSASVSGPAAVTVVQNTATTITGAGTPLNAQNNYTWNYPLRGDCSSPSGTVPFAAYRVSIPSSGLYTFTMNPSGFSGVVHLYSNFDPLKPCVGFANLQDPNGNIVTGSSVTIPVSVFSSPVDIIAVFSAQNTGTGGTFSASVIGPGVVTVAPPGDLTIVSQPSSKSVTKGCVQTLSVYATGPLPQTFQWYEGISGNMSTSLLISSATSNTYTTPPMSSDKSYWVRVTSGNNHVDSNTIAFKVYQTNKTQYNASLDPNQTWKLMTTFCNPSNTFVHYQSTQIRIPADGNYTVHVTRAGNFTSGYAIHAYQGNAFDATQPCGGNFWDLSVNSDLTTHYVAGTYTIVVSATSASQTSGDFGVTVSTTDDCSLPETLEQALIVSGNPLDKAITPNNTATLTFAYTGGTGMAKSIQWYKGISGDTSQPIQGATTPTYTTPVLTQSPAGQPTYYYYWARVSDPGQTTHADTRTAVINVLNPPITYAEILSQCDEVYTPVNGPTSYYKIYPFTVSTDGAYTFNITASGFTPTVRLYQGFFSPEFPNLNYFGPNSTQNLLAGPNTYYLVIGSSAANQTGSFTLTINGPALVVPTPRPVITVQPTDKIIFRNQTATLNVTSPTPDVSYQWFTGTCANKTAVNGASLNSYTTPALTDYKNYWVKVSYGVMYVNSNIAQVQIKPQAINDSYTIDEDAQLTATSPGILDNDIKADSRQLTAFRQTASQSGAANIDNGTLNYRPNKDFAGTDSFTYTVKDGTLTSDPGTVTIVVREINDPPARTAGAVNDHTFTEDDRFGGGPLHLAGLAFSPGGGADEASQTLTYKVTAVPPSSAGNVTLSDGTTVVTANTNYTLAQIQGMQFKLVPNGNGGPYPFTFTVTDNGTTRGVSDPQTLTQSLNITVKPVADTPSATNAATTEDTMTTSGLVLDRNPADGAEVGYFRISTIRNGTLYKADGVTQISSDQYITYAEGHAGLKFKPSANLFSPNTNFSFDVEASLTNSLEGVAGGTVTATITVNPVADQPSVTGATTFVNLQTTSGLVITRNPADGAEIGYYRISSIANGTLYKADGVTPISDGQYIAAAEGAAGLKFTPAQDSTVQGGFNVQGAADTAGNGLGPAAAAVITVNKYNTSTAITSDSPAPSYMGQQVTINFSVQNTTQGGPVPTGDVTVTASGGLETCTAAVAAGGCTLTLNNAGNPRTLTAAYNGNGQFESSSGTKDHVVNDCTQNTVVTSKDDDGSTGTLRYIVKHACAGSTITFDPTVFDPASGPHIVSVDVYGNITGNLLIDKNLTIKGPGANILTVSRSTNQRAPRSRIFNVAAGATVTISGLTITNGFANSDPDSDGGAILNSGTLTLNACAITGNQAGRAGLSGGSGGGIYNKGALTLVNSTVSGNNAYIAKGGGLFNENGGTASIINSTISGNAAATSGGGLVSFGTTTIVNSTITNNTATVSGGGLYNEAGTTTIGNSIVAGNTSPVGPDVLLISGLITSNGHNLVGKNDGADSVFLAGAPNSIADIVGTSGSPVAALLGPLANNGGATQTHLPLLGSPAIDAGAGANLPPDALDLDGNSNTTEPLPIDQRGQARVVNDTVDIGAVEISKPLTVNPVTGAYGGTVNLSAVLTDGTNPASGKSIDFTLNGASVGSAMTDGSGVATLSGVSLAGINTGSYPTGVGASFAGDGGSPVSNIAALTVNKAGQTITFDALTDKTPTAPDFTVSATAGSGLEVNFSAAGNCTVTGSTVHITGLGSCTITASQAGDSNYDAAPNVDRSFNIANAALAITWNNPADIIYGTPLGATQLNAAANVPGTFTYTPAAGTVLASGVQVLHVDFVPADTATYTNASKDVWINVLSASLMTTMTADRNPAPVGMNFNYKVTVTNNGNTASTNTTLLDVLPQLVTVTAATSTQGDCSIASATKTVTCNIGTVAPGSSVMVLMTVKPRDEGTLDNTATLSASQWNMANGNNAASVNGIPAVKLVDLSVSMVDSADPVFVGDDTTYTMTVKNSNTTINATGVTLADSLPSGMTFVSATISQGSLITPPVGSTGIVTANVGVLAPNQTATVTVTVKDSAAGVQTNAAQVTANETDSNPANNTASQSTTVKPAVVVNLQKVLLAKQVLTGGCENTTGNVYLTAPAPAGGVTVMLASNIMGASVPVTIDIPAGQTVSPAFTLTTSPITAKQTGLITATSGTSSVSRGLTINVGNGTCQ